MAYRSNKTGKVSKEVRYLNKDFSQIRNNLIEFSKQYYPNTYKDFTESSPGMMFIEMASYVGDVMSYYVDSQFKESLLGYSEELRTLYSMAQTFGYKPRLTAPSQVTLDIFQLVPAKGEFSNVDNTTIEPDYDYALNIPAGARVETSDGVTFRTIQDCNFKYNTPLSPRTQRVFERDDNDSPTFYLLKKQVQAQSGLTAFRVVMDETNNTPDVIDRNQLVGQLFLQPTRTAEFIVLDFIVQPTGATFPE